MSDSIYYLIGSKPMVNTKLKILERDADTDKLLGEYIGYYVPQRYSYVLYPRYNPFAANNGKLIKHEVAEGLVRFT